MDIKKSKTYKQIKSEPSDKVIAIPYYIDTGLLISEENYEYVIDIELIQYKTKIKDIKNIIPSFQEPDIEKEIRKSIINRIGQNRLEIKFIYVNRETIDDAIKETENISKFYDWV